MLTVCNECNGGVSNRAATCPHCGNPMRRVVIEQAAPVVIEQTAKQYKGRRWARGLYFCSAGLSFLRLARLALIPLIPH